MFSTDYAGKKHGLKEVIKDAWSNKALHHTQAPYNEKIHQQNFSGIVLDFIDKHPDIRFTVYLPPYHLYTWCLSEFYGDADKLIAHRTAVLRELLKRPNVEIHDFQSDPTYVLHHDYFSDVQHFNNDAARKILSDLVSGRRRLSTVAHIQANEKALRTLIAKTMPQYHAHLKQFKKRK